MQQPLKGPAPPGWLRLMGSALARCACSAGTAVLMIRSHSQHMHTHVQIGVERALESEIPKNLTHATESISFDTIMRPGVKSTVFKHHDAGPGGDIARL